MASSALIYIPSSGKVVSGFPKLMDDGKGLEDSQTQRHTDALTTWRYHTRKPTSGKFAVTNLSEECSATVLMTKA
jgi:hypothetical protein